MILELLRFEGFFIRFDFAGLNLHRGAGIPGQKIC
jgi:hypothetical protein